MIKNKEGFTLIELLAVIIILGVLMIIAVPSVTKYINESRKNGYVSTAKNLAGGVRNLVYNKSMDLDDKDTTYYIEGRCLKTENAYKSPFGQFEKAYIAAIVTDNNYEYYWFSVDDTGTGVKKLTNVESLDINSIINGIKTNEISPTISIDKRSNIVVIDGENCERREENIKKIMNSETGKMIATCPQTYTPTIYWAIKDNKLTISNSAVTGDESGSFAGNSTATVPWRNSESLSTISSIEVLGTVAPVSTSGWFSHVGSGASTMDVNFEGLSVCHTTDMSRMFEEFATNVSSLDLDLSYWETSNVTTMYATFSSTGMNSTTFKLRLKDWDTSNVENMGMMFASSGANAKEYVLHIKDWDTSNVNNMNSMFGSTGFSAKNIDFDFSEWDTSNVENMNWMFSGMGYGAENYKLNISGWNMSSVTKMSGMFSYSGNANANYSVIIPKTNGNSTNNTTSLLYGKNTSYSTSPPTGATFTLASN